MSIIEQLSDTVRSEFVKLGIDAELGELQYSDRPDLSDLQCNGALKAAKILKRNPRDIALEIAQTLTDNPAFSDIAVAGPGFINFTLSNDYMLDKIGQHEVSRKSPSTEKIILDYGGPNVAKPLHVGHLRSAIIGEAIKRIGRDLGHEIIGDIHLGDWGTPMGMLIAELEDRHPDWSYFQDDFKPSVETENPPFSVEFLNELYPFASKRSKEDESFAEKARLATARLQEGYEGYRALWHHFLTLSKQSIKSDYSKLDVEFDLWLGESDADPYIDHIVSDLLERGIAQKSDGAIVVPVARETDKKDIPPLMLRKRDGAATYGSTDLATIFERVHTLNAQRIIYVVDKRQSDHFEQVFRASEQAGYMREEKLEHKGFGTMNGADGKPFKTRDGGVMRLTDLITQSEELAAKEAGFDPDDIKDKQEIIDMLTAVAIGAIKYGDLKNPLTSDYIFDLEAFVKFEGDTGPYLQYGLVRCRSILDKANQAGLTIPEQINLRGIELNEYERSLILGLLKSSEAIERSFERRMPSDLCAYTYDLTKSFSAFYTNCYVLEGVDENTQALRLFLTHKTAQTLGHCLNLLAIPQPEKMIRGENYAKPRP